MPMAILNQLLSPWEASSKLPRTNGQLGLREIQPKLDMPWQCLHQAPFSEPAAFHIHICLAERTQPLQGRFWDQVYQKGLFLALFRRKFALFQKKVWKRMINCGLKTITYVEDFTDND
jgi:hypothetical protein